MIKFVITLIRITVMVILATLKFAMALAKIVLDGGEKAQKHVTEHAPEWQAQAVAAIEQAKTDAPKHVENLDAKLRQHLRLMKDAS